MVIMQMHPERNMSSWVTHLCKGFEGFFFLGEGLQQGGHFFLFTGKWIYNWGAYKLGERLEGSSLCLCQTFRDWGRCKQNKTEKTLLFECSTSHYLLILRMGYHKLHSCTFLSGTVKCRVTYALYTDCML